MQLRYCFFGVFGLACSLAFGSLEPLYPGTGAHHRRITTTSPLAQRYYDQGIAFLYGFNHDEAARSFRAALEKDPKCAMALWGLALTNGPHINFLEVSPEQSKTATENLRLAKAYDVHCTSEERALIDAASVRYADRQPKDRRPLDVAFAHAMGAVWKRFPRDADIGALYAESMMDLRPWDFWTHDGKPQPTTMEIAQTLSRVLAIDPRHPQGLHLSIHLWEGSPHPERAKLAADRMRNLMPGLGHMVHMPSHIDVRVGSWSKAIAANERAIAVDDAYRKGRPQQGLYRMYMAHNRHMLAFAAMMTGQSTKAIHALDVMTRTIPPDFVRQAAPLVDGFMVMPLEGRVRFGRWDEVLAAPDYPAYLPLSRAMRHAARGVAYAAKGRTRDAEEEQREFDIACDAVPKGYTYGNNQASQILLVARNLLDGEVALARREGDGAIESLRRAVQAEDAMSYDEPPDWIIPTRHTLGVALLQAGKLREAESVYREDLRRLPNNGWSLYGLSQALAREGRRSDAAQARSRYQAVWREADLRIGSSCMCVPKP